jgi:OOP family OmpA-OmpF porin
LVIKGNNKIKTRKRRWLMAKSYLKVLFIIMISTLLISCGGKQVKTAEPLIKPYELNVNKYEPKVTNFMVILDASSSMSNRYLGFSKFEMAKDFLNAMNQTLPDLKFNGALRAFGHSSSGSKKSPTPFYEPTEYSSAGFDTALKAVKQTGGISPLAKTMNTASNDLKSTQGQIAVIIVSDGVDMHNSPAVTAEKMKSQFGGRLCIYTVLVGDSYEGGKLMERIAQKTTCGFSVRADGFKTSNDMADFVKKIFLTELMDSDGDGVYDNLDRCPDTPKGVKVDAQGCPIDSDGDGVYDYLDKCPNSPAGVKVDTNGCPLDSDGDGVADNLDQCPNTPLGATVDTRGCWTFAAEVLFDINSSKVKSEAYPMLTEAVIIMKKNPDLKVEVDGYADSTGAAAYNMTLSEKRAKAVKKYFVDQGIDPDRLTTKGFGITKPAASNKTKEGRAKNRRVELTPVK